MGYSLQISAAFLTLFVFPWFLILQDVAVLLVLLYPIAITGKWCMFEVFLVECLTLLWKTVCWLSSDDVVHVVISFL